MRDRIVSRPTQSRRPDVFANTFRFDPFSRFRQAFSRQAFSHTFAPRKPRHRVLRVVLGIVGVALLALLVMFGLFVGAAMIVVGLLYKAWKQRGKTTLPGGRDPRSRVLDGEYRVVDPVSLPR